MTPNALASSRMVQVGLVVRNVEESAKRFAAVFGVPVPAAHETDGVEKTNMKHRGKPSTARAKLAFFDMGSLSLELIEPIGGPSTWKEFLDTKGEGVHHIAFMVPDTAAEEATLAAHGIPLVQKGDYTGGRYAYFEAEAKLGVALELLQNIKS